MIDVGMSRERSSRLRITPAPGITSGGTPFSLLSLSRFLTYESRILRRLEIPFSTLIEFITPFTTPLSSSPSTTTPPVNPNAQLPSSLAIEFLADAHLSSVPPNKDAARLVRPSDFHSPSPNR